MLSKIPQQEQEVLENFLEGNNPASKYISQILTKQVSFLTEKMETAIKEQDYVKASNLLAKKEQCKNIRNLIKQRIQEIQQTESQ